MDANSILYSLICIILRCTLIIVGFYIGRVHCRFLFLQTISQDSHLWSSLQFLNSAEFNSTPHSTSTRVVHQIVHQRKISIRLILPCLIPWLLVAVHSSLLHPISLPPSSLFPLHFMCLLHVIGRAQEEERVHARERSACAKNISAAGIWTRDPCHG